MHTEAHYALRSPSGDAIFCAKGRNLIEPAKELGVPTRRSEPLGLITPPEGALYQCHAVPLGAFLLSCHL